MSSKPNMSLDQFLPGQRKEFQGGPVAVGQERIRGGVVRQHHERSVKERFRRRLGRSGRIDQVASGQGMEGAA
jgi:hypothetical protein